MDVSLTTKKPVDSKKSIERRKNIFIILMLLYPMLNFVVFYVLVNFNTILLAFQKTDVNFNNVWVGFDNFVKVHFV